jgi:histidyl-tRNA synthetase
LAEQLQLSVENTPHIYFITDSEKTLQKALILADTLRDQLPDMRILTHCGGGSFKNQFKKADKSGANIALILGEQEEEQQKITIKYLREEVPQVTIDQNMIASFLKKQEK